MTMVPAEIAPAQSAPLAVPAPVAVAPEHFWNYARSTALQRLQKLMAEGRIPPLSVIEGGTATGKSTLAVYLGAWSSCDKWEEQPNPCLDCESCREVMYGLDAWRGKFIEVKGTARDFLKELDEAIRKSTVANPRPLSLKAITPRPFTLCVDGLHEVDMRKQAALADCVERRCGMVTVLLTEDLNAVHARLVSRAAGAVFRLSRPTEDETAQCLRRVAADRGHVLPDQIAMEIAARGGCDPRVCLGLLDELLLDPGQPGWAALVLADGGPFAKSSARSREDLL